MEITPEIRRAREDFIMRLALLKNEAFRLGLYATGQALDQATTRVGWEIDEQERAQKERR